MEPASLDTRIREELAMSGLLMNGFAQRIEVAPSMVSRWLSFAHGSMQLRTLNRIAHHLDCYPLGLRANAPHLRMKRYDELSTFERVLSSALGTPITRWMGVDTFDGIARTRGYEPVYLIRVP